MFMLKDHNVVKPVRLDPAAPRSRVKHSTTEPLRSLYVSMFSVNEDKKVCFSRTQHSASGEPIAV